MEFRDFLQSSPTLRHVQLFHTKEKPVGIEPADGEEIKLMLYKGHRKDQKSFVDIPRKFIEEFFVARSEDDFPIRATSGPQNVSRSQFHDLVIKPSFEKPILVQAYEDTCFMCFLMRPFIESFAKLENSPFEFRRLNIDRNDFPDGFPVTRATPTFILYRDGKPEKWDEFKPNDITTKVSSMPVASTVKEKLQDLVPKVQERFQLFTACIMMQLELERLQEKAANIPVDEEDKTAFEAAVTAMMLADMQRIDDLDANLDYLKTELEGLDEDVGILADMLQVDLPAMARARKGRNTEGGLVMPEAPRVEAEQSNASADTIVIPVESESPIVEAEQSNASADPIVIPVESESPIVEAEHSNASANQTAAIPGDSMTRHSDSAVEEEEEEVLFSISDSDDSDDSAPKAEKDSRLDDDDVGTVCIASDRTEASQDGASAEATQKVD